MRHETLGIINKSVKYPDVSEHSPKTENKESESVAVSVSHVNDSVSEDKDTAVKLSAGQMSAGPYPSGYIEIHVINPTTHTSWDKGKFTDYLISLQTNNRAFNILESSVRHRFSEFIWLRAHLAQQFPDIKPPKLPPRKFFGAQFSEEVIEERRVGLEEFLIKVVADKRYLSDSALHLFLQTSLTLEDITKVIQGKAKTTVLQTILNQHTRNHHDSESTDAGYESSVSFSIGSPDDGSEAMNQSPTQPSSIGNSNFTTPGGRRCLSFPDLSMAAQGRLGLSKCNLPTAKSPESGSLRSCRGGLMAEVISEEYSRSLGGESALGVSYCSESGCSDMASTPDGAVGHSLLTPSISHKKHVIRKKSVTFSPEVTVAEVVDRFHRRPSQVHLTDVPSELIATTLAY